VRWNPAFGGAGEDMGQHEKPFFEIGDNAIITTPF
jgi:hypothetical protein